MRTSKFSKNLLALLVFILSVQFSFAQISFTKDSWENTLAKAKKEKKTIFVHATADWCGWCKKMEKTTYRDPSVAKYFNDNFINFKMDTETKVGDKFSKEHSITGLPTFLFLNGNGNEIHRTAGYMSASSFLQVAETAMGKAQNGSISKSGKGLEFDTMSWDEALKQAKKEKKLIFVHATADWCGWCKKMEKEVYTQSKVGDFFNENFIKIKMDTETAAGKKFSANYSIQGLPTFFFIDGSGKMIHQAIGYKQADVFINAAKTAIDKFSN